MRKSVFILMLFLAAVISCSKAEPIDSVRKQAFDGLYYHDVPFPGWESESKARADLMMKVQWKPLSKVPRAGSDRGWFPAGAMVEGIPYSSVSQEECFVGRDVSFYTFLSAVNNPRSLLYNVDYRSPDVEATGKCCYYGSVCSSTVMYVWGIPYSHVTQSIYYEEIPYIRKKAEQSLDSLQIMDGLDYFSEAISAGHIMMVYDILRDKKGSIKKIVIFESSAPGAHITTYTLDEFKARINKISVPVYVYQFDREKYGDRVGLPAFMEQKYDFSYSFPKALCLEQGDKKSFGEGSEVVIDILSSGFSDIELYKDDALYRTDAVVSDKFTYDGLPVGLYKARLKGSAGELSDFTFFEIGDTDFNVAFDGKTVMVTCPGNPYNPVYVTLNGNIAQVLRRSAPGQWQFEPGDGPTHCRVRFAGKYGLYRGKSIKFKY